MHISKTNRDERTDVNLMIGSPQIILVPDCLVEILEFLKAGIRPPPTAVTRVTSDSKVGNGERAPITLAAASRQENASALTKQRMKVDIKTDRCRVIFVDMGSAPSIDSSSLGKSQQGYTAH